MCMTLPRAAATAVALFLLLFAAKFTLTPVRTPGGQSGDFLAQGALQQDSKLERKNYASAKSPSAGPAPAGVRPPGPDTQKYEKVASVSQTTSAYDSDRAKIAAAIDAHGGIVQVERAAGLKGRRSVYLGIGVPPERFEDFIAAVQSIGQSTQIDIVKNDKTREYLELKARRTTLEKARSALDKLAEAGGSIDERINLQGRLTEIEEKVQALGVSLGEFDTQNELCTVRLSLVERQAVRGESIAQRVFDALAWTATVYAGIGAGFALLVGGLWFAAALAGYVLRLIRAESARV